MTRAICIAAAEVLAVTVQLYRPNNSQSNCSTLLLQVGYKNCSWQNWTTNVATETITSCICVHCNVYLTYRKLFSNKKLRH